MPCNYQIQIAAVMRCCEQLSILPSQRLLLICIKDQKLRLFTATQGGYQLRQSYAISTSAKPPCCRAESFGTPLGLHAIAACIGTDAPLGMVFKAREPIGERYWELPNQAQNQHLITSRIIRLKGLQAGYNAGPGCDSYQRYIYLHGTNHEALIGRPFSAGCIEFHNTDIIELFQRVRPDDCVYIH